MRGLMQIDCRRGQAENGDMKLDLPLAKMSVAEKLAAMETLWADLACHAPEQTAPEWHAEILEERERRLAAGQEEVLDWEDAKRRLRQEIHEGQNP
jgi:putative addiction module component